MTTRARYSGGAMVLHWAIAALMVVQLLLGFRMGGRSAESFALFQLHKSVGVTILVLTLARIAWRLTHRPPAYTAHGWERRLAGIIHVLFYVLLLALPLSGWLIVSVSPTNIPTVLYGTIPWPHLPGTHGLDSAARHALLERGEAVHALLAWVMILAIGLHVAGALKHQWIDRDGTIARMLPGAEKPFDGRIAALFAGGIAVVLFGAWFVPGMPKAAVPAPVESAVPEVAEVVPSPIPEPSASGASPTPAPSASPTEAADAGKLAQWGVQPGGRIGFTTKWSGNALNGTFGDWDADIRFGSAALDQSRATVTIKTGSAQTGESQPDGALPGDDWFASAAFPTATFAATKFRSVGGDRYVASGMLTIRGKARPLSLPFTLKIDGDTARMTGSATIDRVGYGIGWPATDDVPAAVKVSVALTAKRGK